MKPQRVLSPVLMEKSPESLESPIYLPDINISNSLSFSRNKLHYYIAKKTVNNKELRQPPVPTDIKKSIKEEEYEDEDLMNPYSNPHQKASIFKTQTNYDQSLFSEMNLGPKFKKNGELIPYSIVGKSDSFLKNFNILKNRQLVDVNLKSFTVLDEMKTPKSSNLRQNKTDKANAAILSRKGSFRSSAESLVEKNTQVSIHKKPVQNKVNKEQLLKEIAEFERIRQEALKKDEEKLAALKLSDRIYVTKEQRIIEKFEQNNEEWKKNIEKLCQSINRSLDQTVMLQYEEYRRNKEKAEEIEALKEALKKRFLIKDERSELFWYLSLRQYTDNSKETQPRFTSHNKNKKIEEESELRNAGKLILLQDLPYGFQTGVVETKRKEIEKIRKPFLKEIRGRINKTTNSFTSKYNENILDTINQSTEQEKSPRKLDQEDELDDLEVFFICL